MATTVSNHQQTAFTAPVDGDDLLAAVPLLNDNTLRASFNDHDADSGIHFQSGTEASKPAFGTAGRKWYSTDTKRIWYDTGSAWDEISYLQLGGGTLTGGLTVSSGGITVTGNSTITGTLGGITTLTTSGAVTIGGNLTFSAAATKLLSGATSVAFRNNADTRDVFKWTDGSNLLEVGGSSQTFTIISGQINLGTAGVAQNINIGGTACGALALAVAATNTMTLQASKDGDVAISGVLNTTDTMGFLRIPTCAGAPTGAAANNSLVFDTTNLKLYVRVAGAWKSSAAFT